MRRYKKRLVPAHYVDELVERTCDICGRAAKKDPHDWDAGTYEVNTTEVKVTEVKVEVAMDEGDNYPDGGAGTKIVIDICPECFKTKLVEWLKSIGVVVPEIKWDW